MESKIRIAIVPALLAILITCAGSDPILRTDSKGRMVYRFFVLGHASYKALESGDLESIQSTCKESGILGATNIAGKLGRGYASTTIRGTTTFPALIASRSSGSSNTKFMGCKSLAQNFKACSCAFELTHKDIPKDWDAKIPEGEGFTGPNDGVLTVSYTRMNLWRKFNQNIRKQACIAGARDNALYGLANLVAKKKGFQAYNITMDIPLIRISQCTMLKDNLPWAACQCRARIHQKNLKNNMLKKMTGP